MVFTMMRMNSGTWRMFATTLIVAFGSSFHSGYYQLVYNVPQDVLESFVNESYMSTWNKSLGQAELTATWSSVAGINQVGRFISCFVAPVCADRLGRRNTLMIWAAPAAIGFFLQYLAYPTRCVPLLVTGRLITGIYNGLVGIVVPLFLVEIAISSKWRGAVTRVHNVVTVLGSIAALIMGLPTMLGTAQKWAWLPLIPMPLLMIEILWLFTVPESPLHLIEQQKSTEEVEKSFQFYVGTGDYAISSVEEWRNRMAAGETKLSARPKKSYLLLTRDGRRLLALWIALAIASSLAGGSLTNNYSTAILARFRRFSTFAKYSSIIINVFKLVAVLLALYSIDRVGRRVMLLYSSWLVMLCYVFLIAVSVFTNTDEQNGMSFVRIWFVLVWTATQYIVNSTAVLIVSESCRQHLRAFSLALFKIVYHVLSVIVTVTFPAVAAVSEVWSYTLLAIPYAVIIFYLTIVCPETGNVDLLSDNETVEEDNAASNAYQETAKTEYTPLVSALNGVTTGGSSLHYTDPDPFGSSWSAGPREIGPKR